MQTLSMNVELGDDGFPKGAVAEARIDAPPSAVWARVVDLEGYPKRIPMVHRVRRDGDKVALQLKFKVALFSVHFEFEAAVAQEEGRWLEVRWLSGEPRDFRMRFELEPLDDGRAVRVRARGEVDALSLGWLAKYFLKHHPELRYGIVPGVALALLHSVTQG
jgi:carbon monoxide dehydrogenase subunit G